MLEVVEKGGVVALFSEGRFEQFYLCKVVDFGKAKEDLKYPYNDKLFIPKGAPFLQVMFFEVKQNIITKPHVIYKTPKKKKIVYVIPSQVMHPKVNVTYIQMTYIFQGVNTLDCVIPYERNLFSFHLVDIDFPFFLFSIRR